MLSLQRICKNFGAFAALKNVDFSANGGEIVGLLGENGAGKSTLLNIIGGALSPTSGEMIFDGKARHFRSARDASACGIGVVYQHARLVDTFSAGENLALHAQQNGVNVNRKQWNARVESWAQSLGWQIQSDIAVENLSVGERQRIEILKALFAHNFHDKDTIEYSNSLQIGARLLLLDEPTSNLTPGETTELFAVLRRLKNQGRAIVFVSHKLNEVMNLCDRVVVLRRGQVVGERQIAQTNVDELATLMIGEIAAQNAATPQSSTRYSEKNAPFQLKIEKLSGGILRDFSLQIRRGEIVGIAGVDGNGQSELVEILSGLRAPENGNFRCENANVESEIRRDETADATELNAKNAPSAKMRDERANAFGGIAVIPPDRERIGLIGAFDLAENLALQPELRARCRKIFSFDWKVARQTTRDLMTRYDVRAPQTLERTRAADLSGGNQQKLVIARALEFAHGAVVAADPTRGLDIGAARFVHSQLQNAAQNGAAVLLISTDLDEVLSLSDCVGVLYEGRLLPEILLSRDENGEFDREKIGALMGGKLAV